VDECQKAGIVCYLVVRGAFSGVVANILDEEASGDLALKLRNSWADRLW
jgi:hypothetical protein